jgi:hypothetical protein
MNREDNGESVTPEGMRTNKYESIHEQQTLYKQLDRDTSTLGFMLAPSLLQGSQRAPREVRIR